MVAYLKSMQHLLGSLVPSPLLLVLVPTLTLTLLFKSNIIKNPIIKQLQRDSKQVRSLTATLPATPVFNRPYSHHLCPFRSIINVIWVLQSRGIPPVEEKAHLLLLAVILVFALLSQQVQLGDESGEAGAVLRRQVHLWHIERLGQHRLLHWRQRLIKHSHRLQSKHTNVQLHNTHQQLHYIQ